MSKERILVVEDDAAIRDMLCTCLELAGFTAVPAANGQFALQMVAQQPPALILLDWMMPMLSGIEFTRRLKRAPETATIPIIMLTARGEERDRIEGFEEGVDDYVVKPFSPRELVARIKAVLRRVQPVADASAPQLAAEQACLTAGLLQLNPNAKTLLLDQQEVALGPLEFKLLEFFMRAPNRVFSREQLLDNVWGHGNYVDERTVDVQIRRLRKAISAQQQDAMIQTIRGSGYRFTPPASEPTTEPTTEPTSTAN